MRTPPSRRLMTQQTPTFVDFAEDAKTGTVKYHGYEPAVIASGTGRTTLVSTYAVHPMQVRATLEDLFVTADGEPTERTEHLNDAALLPDVGHGMVLLGQYGSIYNLNMRTMVPR